MGKFLFMLLAACVAFLFLWIIFGRKKATDEKVARYTCSICGERDCLCHKEEKS